MRRNIIPFSLFVAVTSLLIPQIAVHAVTYTDTYSCSIPLTRTNWQTGTGSVPFLNDCGLTKFDGSIGNLSSVTITLNGFINSTIGLENRDSQPQSITANVSADIRLFRPDNSVLIVTLPSVSTTQSFPTADGVTDFGGPSGMTVPNLTSTQTQTATLTGASDLALFTGTGPNQPINLKSTAQGLSNYNASANYAGQVDTFASAQATVVYSYQAHNLGINIQNIPQFTAGQDITVNIDAINNETVPTTGPTTITLPLPSGVSFVSVNLPGWTGSVNGSTLTLTTTAPLPGSSTVTLPVTLRSSNSNTGTISLTGTIAGNLPDNFLSNNTSTKTTGAAPALPTPNSPAPGKTTPQVLGVLYRTGGSDNWLMPAMLIGVFYLAVFLVESWNFDPQTVEIDD